MRSGLKSWLKKLYFACAIVAAIMAVNFGARISFGKRASADLEKVVSMKRLEFDVGFKDQLALGIQMSKSPLIKSYMQNPDDPHLRGEAFAEIASYQTSFSSNQTFMINDKDLIYYINNKEQYVLDKNDASSAWYNMTAKMTKDYDLFIDYEMALNATFAWVNAIVRGAKREFLGIIGTGIPVSDFVKTMYGTLPNDIKMYMYNSDRIVSASLDTSLMERKADILEVIPALRGKSDDVIQPKSISFISTVNMVYAICPLPEVGWYCIVSKELTFKEFFINAAIPLALVLLFVLLNVFVLMYRRLLNPLLTLTHMTRDLSSGDADLSRRIDIEKFQSLKMLRTLCGEFNCFIEKVHTIMSKVKNSKDSLVDNGGILHESIDNTSSSIKQIVESLAEFERTITFQIGRVNSTVDGIGRIFDGIGDLGERIDEQVSNVSVAERSVKEMVGIIGTVNSSVSRLTSSFEDLEENARTGITMQSEVNRKIEEIQAQSTMLQEANTMISAIAEQTNLLAMNAAIEAAHAGEAGKGFSVVADEIRQLAETSSEQSRTIGEQLMAIENSISEIVMKSGETQKSFDNVSGDIKMTNEIIVEISDSMKTQAQNSDSINNALASLNDSTGHVKNASSTMRSESRSILNNVQELKDSTANMQTEMDLMNSEAVKINESKKILIEISAAMDKSVKEIDSEVNGFKV